MCMAAVRLAMCMLESQILQSILNLLQLILKMIVTMNILLLLVIMHGKGIQPHHKVEVIVSVPQTIMLQAQTQVSP